MEGGRSYQTHHRTINEQEVQGPDTCRVCISSQKKENPLIIYSPLSRWRWVKCLSLQNPFGVSEVNSRAVKSNTIEFRVSVNPNIKIRHQMASFTPGL